MISFSSTRILIYVKTFLHIPIRFLRNLSNTYISKYLRVRNIHSFNPDIKPINHRHYNFIWQVNKKISLELKTCSKSATSKKSGCELKLETHKFIFPFIKQNLMVLSFSKFYDFILL